MRSRNAWLFPATLLYSHLQIGHFSGGTVELVGRRKDVTGLNELLVQQVN